MGRVVNYLLLVVSVSNSSTHKIPLMTFLCMIVAIQNNTPTCDVKAKNNHATCTCRCMSHDFFLTSLQLV